MIGKKIQIAPSSFPTRKFAVPFVSTSSISTCAAVHYSTKLFLQSAIYPSIGNVKKKSKRSKSRKRWFEVSVFGYKNRSKSQRHLCQPQIYLSLKVQLLLLMACYYKSKPLVAEFCHWYKRQVQKSAGSANKSSIAKNLLCPLKFVCKFFILA